MGKDLHIFYPNATSDNIVQRNTNYDYDEDTNTHSFPFSTGVSFDMMSWFYSDHMKMPGGGKKWYWDDDNTNYDGIVFMITRTLKKFDKWYWRNYIGHTDNQVRMLDTITRVYTTLEKYYEMTSDEISADEDIRRE